jgi:hypothetical protein
MMKPFRAPVRVLYQKHCANENQGMAESRQSQRVLTGVAGKRRNAGPGHERSRPVVTAFALSKREADVEGYDPYNNCPGETEPRLQD